MHKSKTCPIFRYIILIVLDYTFVNAYSHGLQLAQEIFKQKLYEMNQMNSLLQAFLYKFLLIHSTNLPFHNAENLFSAFVSSPDLKGHVRFCHHLVSVRRPSTNQDGFIQGASGSLLTLFWLLFFSSYRDATGMVLHKDSRWYQSWQNFKDNNPYMNSMYW